MGDSINKRNDILILFDVDGTITPARQPIEDEVDKFLQSLKNRVSIGLVGGSDLIKIAEQTFPSEHRLKNRNPIASCIERFDYVFAENGLDAYADGQLIAKQSIVSHIGEEKLQRLINFCLAYMSKLQLPKKRGNFIEFRNGMINVCPVGRSCNRDERDEFSEFDKKNNIRSNFVSELNSIFGPNSEDPLGLIFSIGGQISIDVVPIGWDKTFCLDLIKKPFREIHFFGDKTFEGGNDHEIYHDPRTIGHTVTSPKDTMEQIIAMGF